MFILIQSRLNYYCIHKYHLCIIMSRKYAKWIEENRDKLISISDQIWEFAEIGLEEYKSSEILAKTLNNNTFSLALLASVVEFNFL